MKYGIELELSDIDVTKQLPDGAEYCYEDATIVNSDGTGNDPLKQIIKKGSEIKTRVCNSLVDLEQHVKQILKTFPEATVNYKSNLHIHISDESITKYDIKWIAQYVNHNQIDFFQSLPRKHELEVPKELLTPTERVRRSHSWTSRYHTISDKVLKNVLDAPDNDEAICKALMSDANPYYGFRRHGINIRQLFAHGTIEFRCFNGSLSLDEIMVATMMSEMFFECMKFGEHFEHTDKYKKFLPQPLLYSSTLQELWMLTNFQHQPRETAWYNLCILGLV